MDYRKPGERPFWFWIHDACGHATTEACDPVERKQICCAGCGQVLTRNQDGTFTEIPKVPET